MEAKVVDILDQITKHYGYNDWTLILTSGDSEKYGVYSNFQNEDTLKVFKFILEQLLNQLAYLDAPEIGGNC
jgi:hypothetical protein